MFRKATIALLLVVGLAGCRSTTTEELVKAQCDDNRDAIERHIPDAARKAAMLEVVNDFEVQIEAIAADSKDARKRYDAALRCYGTTDAELESIQAELENRLDRLCAAARSHSLELRKHCSSEEWERITAHYHSAININYL